MEKKNIISKQFEEQAKINLKYFKCHLNHVKINLQLHTISHIIRLSNIQV